MKISVAPFRGKASGRVATSHFTAGRIKPYPTSAFHISVNSTFLIIVHPNLDGKHFLLVLQAFPGVFRVIGFMTRQVNFPLRTEKNPQTHRCGFFIVVNQRKFF